MINNAMNIRKYISDIWYIGKLPRNNIKNKNLNKSNIIFSFLGEFSITKNIPKAIIRTAIIKITTTVITTLTVAVSFATPIR